MKKETAFLAMGCFWQSDLLFAKTPSVIKTIVGYIGGNEEYYPNPTYKQICSGGTGYAEAVKITFNAEKISYKKLLEIFWNNHNPTTLNCQGKGVREQYRSAIFYTTEKQKKEAEESKKEKQKSIGKKIVTKIIKAPNFFTAEDYHQKYLEKGGLASCHI